MFSPDLPASVRTAERNLYRLTVADHVLSRAPSARGPRLAARTDALARLWELADFSVQDAAPVQVLEEVTFDAFVSASAGYRRPVVIRGFGEDIQAVREWSPAYLVSRMGDAPCTVVEMDEAAMSRPHDSKRVLLQMAFSDFIERMDSEPLYLHNSTEFASQFPDLLDEIELERVGAALTTPGSSWDEIFSSNLFVGTDRVFSNLHCAPGGNFFLQITGEKTWTLVDPARSAFLLPLPSKPFNHCLSIYGSFRAQGEDSPLWRLPRQTVTLKPGDLLYNPPWWWHEVENSGPTIGCALRHVPRPLQPSPTWANHPLFSALSVYPKLWAASAASYLRHQLDSTAAPMRSHLNPRLAEELNRARGR